MTPNTSVICVDRVESVQQWKHEERRSHTLLPDNSQLGDNLSCRENE